jgi:hypothetical protein
VSPRKKASPVPESAPSPSGPQKIVCPACKSEISGDGSTLHAKSNWLEELIEEAGGVPELEKAIDGLGVKLTAERAEKEKWKQAAQSKTEETKNANVGTEQATPKRGSWW